MKNGMLIIDADGHAVDAEPMYRERLPERYRKRNFIHPSDDLKCGHVLDPPPYAVDRPRHHNVEAAPYCILAQLVECRPLLASFCATDTMVDVGRLNDCPAFASAIARSTATWLSVVCASVLTRA
jgi:hypothetical protein